MSVTQVNNLPSTPAHATQTPVTRSYLENIAFDKAHGVAMSCFKALIHWFMTTFSCFYPAYNLFYNEEMQRVSALTQTPPPASEELVTENVPSLSEIANSSPDMQPAEKQQPTLSPSSEQDPIVLPTQPTLLVKQTNVVQEAAKQILQPASPKTEVAPPVPVLVTTLAPIPTPIPALAPVAVPAQVTETPKITDLDIGSIHDFTKGAIAGFQRSVLSKSLPDGQKPQTLTLDGIPVLWHKLPSNMGYNHLGEDSYGSYDHGLQTSEDRIIVEKYNPPAYAKALHSENTVVIHKSEKSGNTSMTWVLCIVDLNIRYVRKYLPGDDQIASGFPDERQTLNQRNYNDPNLPFVTETVYLAQEIQFPSDRGKFVVAGYLTLDNTPRELREV